MVQKGSLRTGLIARFGMVRSKPGVMLERFSISHFSLVEVHFYSFYLAYERPHCIFLILLVLYFRCVLLVVLGYLGLVGRRSCLGCEL